MLELTKKREEKFGVFLRHYEGSEGSEGEPDFFLFISFPCFVISLIFFFYLFNIPPLAGATGQGGN